MLPSIDLTTLNHRLVALSLPVLTHESLAGLPAPLSRDRIEHALRKAEGGEQGAWRFLSKNLPASAPPTPAPPTAPASPTPPTVPARQAAPRPGATPNADTVPTPAPHRPAATPSPDTAPARPPAANPDATPSPDTAPAPTPARPVAPRPGATPNGATAVTEPPRPGLAPTATTAPPDRVQCRVYGGKAALCIESDQTRQHEPTLRIEAARATAPREYDWRQKLALQLTREELPVIAATVLGLLPRCEYKNHGPNQDKGLEIVHQGTHLFVRLFQKERGVLAVPVTAVDRYALGALCLRQLRKTSPWLSDRGVLTLLKLTVQRMATPTA